MPSSSPARRPPTRKSSQFSSTPPRSVTNKKQSPHSSFRQFSPVVNPYDRSQPQGTKRNPFPVLVNFEYPELNSARFQITHVPNYLHEGFRRSVWEVSVDVPHADFHKWGAQFLPPNRILVNGPSRSYWQRASILWDEKCHDYKDKKKNPFPANEAKKQAHQAAELAIEDDPNRQSIYWLVEIPPKEHGDPEVLLDNTILSGAGNDILRDIRKLQSLEFQGLKGATLAWCIAEHGGVQTEKQEEKVPDVAALLDL